MGKSQESNTISKFEPPEWTKEQWPEYIARAKEIANEWATNPNLVYGNRGERLVAPLVQEQIDAIGGLRGLAMPLFGNQQQMQQTQGAENDAYMRALQGGMGQGPSEANAFMGVNNQYLDQLIGKNTQDMARAYSMGTAATRNMNSSRARALGSTADAELGDLQQRQFLEGVGDMANNARMQAYQQSAGLDEARIGRDWNAAEQNLGRQFGAVGMQPQRMAGNIGLLQALLGGGELSRNLGQQQIEAYKNLHYQNQQLPLIGLDIFGGALTRGSGGAGQTTQQMFGGYSPWATAGGLASIGGGLMNQFGWGG